jgi:cobalt-zinc-cadmium efflux system membrane fusion protein
LSDWQQAQADLSTAETQLTAARNRLRILGRSEAEIQSMEQQRTGDPVAYVLAPISGVVTDRQVGPGQYLQAGAGSPVYTVGDLSSVWVMASAREDDAALIGRGAPVEVHVPALPGRVFHATVSQVNATVDSATHRVAVRATLPNPDGVLRPDMFASFTIATSPPSLAPAVPEEAVVREGEQARVWTVGQGDALELREIRTGRIHEGRVEVLAGLSRGERVVTRGSLFIDRAAQP